MKYREEIFAVLRFHKLRLTKTRQAVVELFVRNETPLSVPDILLALHKRQAGVNKTTVYRELERLQAIGVLEPVQLGDRKQYYELASRKHHHHLVCLQCERVEDIDMDEAVLFAEERKWSREKHFIILRHSLEFFGLCRQCQAA
ncbi:MAG: hypothetical protein A3E38_03145 [Candidatus Moranbacteria bacterium RIFCSPHIGHO2_12_FULL_54_9]|nr:MAG: hypothetical protein A2878_00270 [Candidatus Moranbacteria bacterium RIFCSPHIGHO2_01_FULL_54_31]OGI25734.1 MAG: hypothetical protein A3E38_03145 [Candidatus Moranbacteria bacterium RIFCSPHIGHO2_12_FULL_54_9]